MKKRRGFTLIELLVVISIIALLISILMPALSKAREQAKSVVCMGNERQVGLAMLYYADEWDDYVPRGTSSGERWFRMLMPYLGQEAIDSGGVEDYRHIEIFSCPSYPSDKEAVICYVINDWGDGYTGANFPTRLSRFGGRASEIIYLADSEAGDWRPDVTNENSAEIDRLDVFLRSHMPCSINEYDKLEGRRVANSRHNVGSNSLFLDGHVEWVDSNMVLSTAVLTEEMYVKMWRGN